jgi:alkylglycerol monooxygenase
MAMDFDTLIHDKGVQTAGAVLISVFLVFNLIEFTWSQLKKNSFFTLPELIINVTIALLQQLTDVFNKLIFILGYVYVLENFSAQELFDMTNVPVGLPVTFGSEYPFVQLHGKHIAIWLSILLIADFCQYWLHRLSHEVNILWAGHIVHHSMEAYNFAVALRQSFIESLYTWIFYLPLAFLGVPWQLFIMAYTISLIWQFLVHTRYIDKLGWLEYLFSTPSHHRVHHGKNDMYIDKNYGALLIIWDRLFGTFEPETEPVRYGIKSSIDTHNPIWVNTHHHIRISKLIRSTQSLKNKWQVIFGRPAFIPDDSSFTESSISYAPATITAAKKVYIILNFLAIAVFSVMQILYFDAHRNGWYFAISAALIMCSHFINISLLENKIWADAAEIARLMLLIVLGGWLHIAYQWEKGILLAGLAMFLLGFTFWIARDFKQRQISSLHAH